MWYYNIGTEAHINRAQQEANATEIYNFLYEKGFTVEAIAGILGNMSQESGVNPGCKEAGGDGWGLIQWTPHRVLTNWCNRNHYNWYDGAAQIILIYQEFFEDYDVRAWYKNSDMGFTYTASEFMALTDVDECAQAYCWERERPRVQDANVPNRIAKAREWYAFLTGQPIPPTPPTPPTPVSGRNKMPLYMYLRRIY